MAAKRVANSYSGSKPGTKPIVTKVVPGTFPAGNQKITKLAPQENGAGIYGKRVAGTPDPLIAVRIRPRGRR